MTNPSVIRSYMRKYNFFFKKNLGQNFLTDANIAQKIVNSLDLCGDETVLEIGPGAGALTQYLTGQAHKVYAVEIDPFAVLILQDAFRDADNLEIIRGDILKIGLRELLDRYDSLCAVSNLPYYITSPVVLQLLQCKLPFKKIVVMMQKEVAQRFGAKIGTKDYSAFTIGIDYYAEAQILFDVAHNVFMPSPKVDSACVLLVPRKEPKVKTLDEKFFFKTLKVSFATRRKTILNCLSNGFNLPKEAVAEKLSALLIAQERRAETISIEDYARISDAFCSQ